MVKLKNVVEISGLNFPAVIMYESCFPEKTGGWEHQHLPVILKEKTAHLGSCFNFTGDFGH